MKKQREPSMLAALVLGACLTLPDASLSGQATNGKSTPAGQPKVVNGYTQIDKPFQPADFAWVSRTLKKVPTLKSDKPRYNIWVLGDGEEMKKSVAVMIFDESQGPGKGSDTLYVDKNFNGDLTEQDEKIDIKLSPGKVECPPFAFKDAEGRRSFGFQVSGWVEDKPICNPSLIAVSASGLYAGYYIGANPGIVRFQWANDLKTAPIYHIGAPLYLYTCDKMPGSSLGTWTAGSSVGLGSYFAIMGDKPGVQLRAQGGLPTFIRILEKDGSIKEDIPFAGRIA